MIALSRAGWILSAAVLATILASLRYVDYVGPVPVALLALLALLCALRPRAGVEIVAALIPVAWFLAVRRWNFAVGWAEAVACAAIVGLSVDAARTAGARRVPFAVAAPAFLFGLVVVGSMIASLGVQALRLGPGFTDALWTHLVREYFVDERGFPALHAGMLLLQGTLLFALAARLIAARAALSGSLEAAEAAERRLRRLAATVAIGAALAAMLNVGKLVQSALRSDTFMSALLDLSQQHRWNVHYADYNAAGSFFVMAALAALALAVAIPARRVAWAAGAVLVTAALWLTGSRAAYVAGVLGLAAALLAARVRSVRHGLGAATLTALAAIALVAVIAALAPQRGNQQSSVLALDTRVGMAKVAAAMIATRPAFGIGLGEFPGRAGEFISLDLAAKFPVAFQENAHNNFLQIAAELGLVGGVLFTWLVAAALFVAIRRSRGSPFILLVTAGLLAFVISWLGGHPLLVPEAAYVFWILLGAAAGAAVAPSPRGSRRATAAIAVCAVAIAMTVPWRVRAMMDEANLEHVGIGVSAHWQRGPDDARYREATGHATLFAPTGSAFRLRVNPRADGVLKLELKLDGRVADVVTVLPNTWTQLSLPARTQAASARYTRLDLRLIDADQTRMWITKIEPLR